jgi:hypothetical protein
LVDINADGHIDLISGSWPGELFLFLGGPGRTFAAPVTIEDKNGEVINTGGGVRKQASGGLLITGDAKFEQTPEGTFVTYKGKRYESTPEEPIYTTGCASAVHAVDWDGDGDFDLLVGDIQGNVVLIPNEGTAKSYAFGKAQPLQVGADPLKVAGDAGPFTADWDGDGDLDLLVGAGDGSVTLFRNIGTRKTPKLAATVTLVPAGATSFGSDAPKTPTRGIRAKVCAADWNGDGRLDLLVGDFATQAPDLPEPTPEEKAKHAELKKQLDEHMQRYRTLVDKVFGANRPKTKEGIEKVNKELGEVTRAMQEIRSQLPPEYENHGWVWLFPRLPEREVANER